MSFPFFSRVLRDTTPVGQLVCWLVGSLPKSISTLGNRISFDPLRSNGNVEPLSISPFISASLLSFTFPSQPQSPSSILILYWAAVY